MFEKSIPLQTLEKEFASKKKSWQEVGVPVNFMVQSTLWATAKSTNIQAW